MGQKILRLQNHLQFIAPDSGYFSLHIKCIFLIPFFQNVASINSDSQDDIQGIFVSSSDDANLLSSVRRRVQISKEKVKTGSLNVLSAKYEVCKIHLITVTKNGNFSYLQSLDYDTCENHLLLDEERKKGYKFIIRKSIARWFVFLLIGACTALIACVIDISIEELSILKYRSLSKCILLQL